MQPGRMALVLLVCASGLTVHAAQPQQLGIKRTALQQRDLSIDNITLYWLTGTGASAARWYWEFGQFLATAGASGAAPPPVSVPVAFTAFPGEIWAAPRSWVETVYPDLAYFNAVDRGGHFAAWEEPALFASELRAAFKPLR
jgi:hypothetical protein